MKIYVSNLTSHVKETDLEEVYSAFGEVESVKIFSGGPAIKSRRLALVSLKDRKQESLTLLQRLLRRADRVRRLIYMHAVSMLRKAAVFRK